MNSILTEYDEEQVLADIGQERYEDGVADGITKGIAKGKTEAILELLEDYGKIPEELKEKILAEEDVTVLKHWHKLAAKTENIEEFVRQMNP